MQKHSAGYDNGTWNYHLRTITFADSAGWSGFPWVHYIRAAYGKLALRQLYVTSLGKPSVCDFFRKSSLMYGW